MKPLNIMLDLETLGTDEDAVIVSIGAVTFDEYGVLERFYEIIDIEKCPYTERRGISLSTVKWWMLQSGEAREVFEHTGITLREALTKFRQWATIATAPESIQMWGNGADFDNRILANAYKQTGVELPWKYWNNRCYKTMKSLFKVQKPERHGVHHNAVDDAEFQAEHLLMILRELRGMRELPKL